MPRNKSISLNKIVYFNLLTITLLATSVIGLLWFLAEYRHFNEMIVEQEEAFFSHKKKMLQKEVGRIVDYIDFMNAKKMGRLEREIRNRTYEAHAIASNLYQEHGDSLNNTEIAQLIKDALRPIHFNTGRGYYFAASLDGVQQLHSNLPELEGVNFIEFQDNDGRYIVRDMIDLIEKQGEGYYRYNYMKPGISSDKYPKIAFIKYFQPLNWFLGTGGYLDIATADIQKEVIERIEQVQFGKDGYVFAGTLDGVSLAGPAKGQNMLHVTDSSGIRIVEELIDAAKEGGGFVKYTMPEFEGVRNAPKLSYAVSVKDWDWYIGAGEYVGDIEAIIARERLKLQDRIRSQLLSILLILGAIFILAMVWARIVTGRIKANFSQFSAFFSRAATKYSKIDTSQLDLLEFSDLADNANRMIDARKDAAQKLHESKKWADTILESIQSGIIVIDAKTHQITEVNDEAARILEYPKERIINRPCHEFLCQYEKEQCLLQDIGKPVDRQEQQVFTSTGQRVPVIKTAKQISSNGREYIIESFIDISEKKALEERLRQSERMQALGTLAGGIAHDFNNLMMGIQGRTSLMLQMTSSAQPHHEHLQSISQYIDTATHLTTQLLGLTRGGRYEVQPIDINEVLRQQVVLFGRTRKEITIAESYGQAIQTAEVDRNQIIQVIWNLFINAGHAMPSGGLLEVKTKTITIKSQDTSHGEDVRAGDYVAIMIKDSGTGMDEETARKAFDPFFTTKAKDRGTGLGLASVYGIIKNHKGHIKLTSTLGAGTTVTILLPASSQEPVRTENHEPGLVGGSGMILLIDDEDIVREVGSEMLKSLGYSTRVAANGEEGAELYQMHKDDISLIILDMIMPTMSGKQTYQKLKEINGEVKVMLASGYSQDGDIENLLSKGCNGFIQKPFSLEKLSHELKKIL